MDCSSSCRRKEIFEEIIEDVHHAYEDMEMLQLRQAFELAVQQTEKIRAESAEKQRQAERQKQLRLDEDAVEEQRRLEAEQRGLEEERERQVQAETVKAAAPVAVKPLKLKPPEAPKSKLQHHKEKAKSLLVRHVNPKFVHFDKPFLLAVIVGLCTWSVFAVIFNHLMLECTTSESSKAGGTSSQVTYIVSARKAGLTICLKEATFLSTYSATVVGDVDVAVLQESRCQPPDFYMSWPQSVVDKVVKSDDLQYATGLAWCSGAEATALSACQEDWKGTCPPCDVQAKNSSSKGAPGEIILNAVYEKVACPSVSSMFGVALSYAQQSETLLTVFIVFSLMAGRVLHQHGPNGKEGLCDSMKKEAEQAAEDVADDAGNAVLNAV
mmetsp:Transcript_96225/g.170867  ORF Transcript_96225/g.170867 Transcript_96225/m.170867 type:complete len:382 (-) Transcript_96225:13-1158(-)